MTVRIGVGVSTQLDLLAAAAEAGDAAVTALGGRPVDLALVFASGGHLGAPEAMLERIHATVAPQVLAGCGANGVLGCGRELESGTAVAVWAAAFDGAGEAKPFHVTVGEEDGEHVIDGGKPECEQGDFLVRGVLGADASMGAIAVGASVNEGQVVRLHVRDARSAGQDLRRALRLRVEAVGSERLAGALVFSCNGRGQAMFGPCDHDAAMVQRELRGAPSAGFFAAGELGPVGWRSFLHTFTATVGMFPS